MASRRLLVALLLVALLAGGVFLLVPPSSPGQAGSYPVTILAPDGGTYWDGVVTQPGTPTVLTALQEASRLGGFALDVEPTSLGAYVRGIGPYEETATAGWCFFVDAGHGYAFVASAADQTALHPGDKVRWSWNGNGSGAC
jgi:hypothetical protein